jgi:M6 family metalloprotease-like protein
MREQRIAILVFASLLIAFTLPLAAENAPAGDRAPSIVSLRPEAGEALKAQGRKFKYPFPNYVNQGRKFSPGGEVIPPLKTAQEQYVLVLFVSFSTPPPGGPAVRYNLQQYDDLLFGTTYDPPEYAGLTYPSDRTLRNYYTKNSYGQVEILTLNLPSQMGWANVNKPYTDYCNGDNGFGWYPNNVQGLVIDAIKAVDDDVDFSKYAVNGEVPNLFVVFAGTGAEWTGDPSLIWSHSWDLSSYTGLNGYWADGVKINNYAMMPEIGGDMTDFLGGGVIGPFPPTVGVFAHEYAHVLGLPDQYDYGYESQGTGRFSLMAGGSWNQFPLGSIFSGNSPSNLDAWSKYRLGFVEPQEITATSHLVLPPSANDQTAVYKMVVPNSGGKEYFLFENRQRIDFDQGLIRRTGANTYESLHGLAIFHIDDVVLSRNYWRPNEAENWKEFRSEGWRKAANGETHYGISIIQADDQWSLETGYSAGNGGDLYPGIYGVTSFGNYTFPNSSSYYFWGGSEPKFGYSGITVSNITETGTVVSADFSFEPFVTPSKR